MASEAERYLRGLAVDRLRIELPSARIIHELNVEQGFCRVDLAAVTEDRIVFAEIKSRKDKLDRLRQQVRIFRPCCHEMVVCWASERWDFKAIYDAGGSGCTHWPENEAGRWNLARYERTLPGAPKLLNLLWREELAAEARRHRVAHGSRTPRLPLINMLAMQLTAAEATRAVCRQLRARSFAEADAPIPAIDSAAPAGQTPAGVPLT